MKSLLLFAVTLSLSGLVHAKEEKTRKPSNRAVNLDEAKAAASKYPGAIIGINGQNNDYSAQLELPMGTTYDVNPATFVELINSVCNLKAYISIIGSRVAFCTAK